ncbi:MAG: hypothetical protein PUI31_03985 [Clostridia bacterium]|nr:hypothetical protein [Clostridia bacterium]
MRKTANSAWGYGLITKRFWSPRGNGVAVVRIRVANLAEGLPLAGNGKFRMGLRYDYKKVLKSTRQLVAVVRIRAANLAEGLPHAGNGKFRMGLRYDYKKVLESARQLVAVVRRFSAKQFLTK